MQFLTSLSSCFDCLLFRDNLLLETGFLCILVAPLTLIRGSRGVREHDHVTFWLTRWLLFRLMFASGVVKLTSRCPTWWGLTGTDEWLYGCHLCCLYTVVSCFLFPFHSVIFLHLITLSLFLLCVEQPSRITTRLSVSQPLWPGLPTSCRCAGRSWAWWEPSLSRSLFRSCSSVHCGGSDLELFTCRWKEMNFFTFCFSFTCSIINFNVGSKMKSVCFLSSCRCCFKSSSFCLATTTSSTCWLWPSVCHFWMIAMSISGCARHTRLITGMMVWNFIAQLQPRRCFVG